MLELIHKHFICIWIHGNNNSIGRDKYQRYVPNVLEATFINRNLITDVQVDHQTAPGPLDAPNNPFYPDHLFNWWWSEGTDRSVPAIAAE